jgi:Subtilase family
MPRNTFTSLVVLLSAAVVLRAQGGPELQTLPAPKRLPSASRLANAAEARAALRLAPGYDNVAGVEKLKIAVLDYGFDGIDGVKPYLPANAVLIEHYDPEFIRRFHLGDPAFRKSFAPLNNHGRTMAQIVWAVTGFHPEGPKFYLLNANGPTLFGRAVRYAIEEKVDIILFSGTFEGAGNGDGRGPINRMVAEALAAGIIWINAAGNTGGHVYNGPVDLQADDYLRLGKGQDATALRFRNLLDENTVTITLTWNDYREEEDAGTSKDLDLYVEDGQGRPLAASAKTQVGRDKNPGPEESRNPRERLVLQDLAAAPNQEYRIRVKARSKNFTAADRLRVLITSSREAYVDPKTGEMSDAIQFLDASGKGEIFPPADHPLVLTVGDSSALSARGPTEDHRVKPDVLLDDSRAVFSSGEVSYGASNAAAYFAGAVALMKAAEPALKARHLLWLAHYGAKPTSGEVRRVAEQSTLTPRQATRGTERLPAPRPSAERSPFASGVRPMHYQQSSDFARTRSRYSAQQRPLASSPVTAPAQRVPPPRPLWQTPTRQELAEAVRLDR